MAKCKEGAVARFRDTTDKAWKATKNPKRGKRKPYWTKDWNRPQGKVTSCL